MRARSALALAALAAALALLQWGAPRVLNPYYLTIATRIGVAIIAAVSLQLVSGFTGQFSIGHAGFMAVGAYASAALSVYLGGGWLVALGAALPAGLARALYYPLPLLVGGALAAHAGLLVGIPAHRLRGDYLAIATLGFGEIIRVVILNTDAVGGARGLGGIPILAGFASVYGAAVLCVVSIWRMVYSQRGLTLFAIREDEIAAAAMGIDTTRYKTLAFVVGAFWAGLAGGLLAHFIGYIHTNSFTFLRSVEIVVMVVLGGLGSITGAVVSAALLTVLPEVLRFGAEYRMVIYSLLLIVLMLTRPSGLMGGSEITRWRFWSSTAAR